MAKYNLDTIKSATTMQKLFETANDYTGDVFVGFMMLAIFFIMFLALKRFRFDYALISSSFACFVLSIFLTYAGLLNFIFPLIFLAMTAFTGLYLYAADR